MKNAIFAVLQFALFLFVFAGQLLSASAHRARDRYDQRGFARLRMGRAAALAAAGVAILVIERCADVSSEPDRGPARICAVDDCGLALKLGFLTR